MSVFKDDKERIIVDKEALQRALDEYSNSTFTYTDHLNQLVIPAAGQRTSATQNKDAFSSTLSSGMVYDITFPVKKYFFQTSYIYTSLYLLE